MAQYRYSGAGFAKWRGAASRYDSAFLVKLLREMLRIRIIEEEIEKRYHEDQMKTPIHLVIGQEATSVGCCAALRIDDLLYSSHRTHGNYLAKGGDLKAMLCEMFCRVNGCAGSRGGSMHLIDKRVGMAGTSAIVAGAIPIATGAALAAQVQKLDRATVVFLGDAGTEEGATSESLNFAALKKLPIVFFCENNFYSVQSPLATRQPARELHRWAAGYAMPAACIDGMNVLEVYEATREAVARARRGAGPTFIEARCYRYRAHGGAGDDSRSGYREIAERADWVARCPITMYADFLAGESLVDEPRIKALREEIIAEMLEALEFAAASPNPTEADLYKHVYAD